MRGLHAADLLDLIADGAGLRWPERADLLLRMALPEADRAARDGMSVGARDRHLLTLRALTFGASAAVRTSCPACAEEVEADVDTGALLRGATEPTSGALRLRCGGQPLEARLPTAGDLRELAGRELESHAAAEALVARCVRREDGDAPVEIDASLRAALAAAVAAADPLADIRLDVACPGCRHTWTTSLDVVSFFWQEIEARATRVAWSVHRLASRYGWSEADILAMSPARRGMYLAMAVGS